MLKYNTYYEYKEKEDERKKREEQQKLIKEGHIKDETKKHKSN
jgi:hypothetical protein